MLATWVDTPEFKSLFDDTVILMDDLRDYIRQSKDRENLGLDRDERLDVTHTVSRMTILMTSTMAWLLLHRAVHNGEVEMAKLVDEGVELQEVIARDRPVIEKPLPSHSPVCALVARGQAVLDKINALHQTTKNAAAN